MQGNCSGCGTQVWAGARPSPRELVICPTCYMDCSIAPGFRQRLRQARYRLAKTRKLFPLHLMVIAWTKRSQREAFKAGLKLWMLNPFLLDRERKGVYDDQIQKLKVRQSKGAVIYEGSGWAAATEPRVLQKL